VQILEAVRPAAAKRGLETPAELWAFFVEQCRSQLHAALCFSPGSNAFRERLRANPALVNCCTIDWFHQWPADALEAVADKFLRESDLQVPRPSCLHAAFTNSCLRTSLTKAGAASRRSARACLSCHCCRSARPCLLLHCDKFLLLRRAFMPDAGTFSRTPCSVERALTTWRAAGGGARGDRAAVPEHPPARAGCVCKLLHRAAEAQLCHANVVPGAHPHVPDHSVIQTLTQPAAAEQV
jgi:hypothetical protein